MKIAVIYNRSSQNVINLFGVPNRERYGLAAIKRITDALKKGRHQVLTLEGDKELIHRLEQFMPQVIKGERPGMVFNLSYGIQGQARYTHVPGILEMLGIPYVGSGPLAHSLSLDKVVAKSLFRQHNLPTPDFAVLDTPDFPKPPLNFPLIVKPRNESTSFGIKVVHDEAELRDAANNIFDKFNQAVLVEQYIDGREINVGLIGNSPSETFQPAEVHFDEGPPIYTLEDKKRESGREVRFTCPAKLPAEITKQIQEVSRKAFEILGCADCARVDLRLSKEGKPYILEINSLPSLGEHGSYVMAAEQAGLDFPGLINRLVDAASARYFGTPNPPAFNTKNGNSDEATFSFLTSKREQLEKRLEEWVNLTSRTSDAIGVRRAFAHIDTKMRDIGLRQGGPLKKDRITSLFESGQGLDGGTLIVTHVDIPFSADALAHGFKKDPEWLYGEGIGASRGALVMLEFALRALKHRGLLKKWRGGVIFYGDEGQDNRFSRETIKEASRRAERVLVLSPGTPSGKIVTGRRGLKKFRLIVEGDPMRLGHSGKRSELSVWFFEKLAAITKLTDKKTRLSVSVSDFKLQAFPTLLPHRFEVVLNVSYGKLETAEEIEKILKSSFNRAGWKCEVASLAKRPAMTERTQNIRLAESLIQIAERWDIGLKMESSVSPSVAGLVPKDVPVVCGLSPLVQDLYTPNERIQRISLVQRTLILAQYLIQSTQKRTT